MQLEVKDLREEFESQRADYLETIRKQERGLVLLNGIIDKVCCVHVHSILFSFLFTSIPDLRPMIPLTSVDPLGVRY